MKVPLESTYVRFREDDIVGQVLAYITLCPIYLMVMYTTLVVFRRDFGTLFALFGQMLNLALNKLLKKIVNQPRPDENSDYSDSGMPSNHSQFICYFCMFYIIQSLSSKLLPPSQRYLYSFGLGVLAYFVCFSRFYLSYHTSEQILGGVSVGIVSGFVWSLIYLKWGDSLGNLVCSIPLIKYLGLRHFSTLEQYLLLRRVKAE